MIRAGWVFATLAMLASSALAGEANKVYEVRRMQGTIRVDGRLDEPAWKTADCETGFVFPWKKTPAPRTRFRALWDEKNLYLAFEADDTDLVIVEDLKDEMDAVFEDRVELYLAADDKLANYYCLEIDPRGRILDYRARYYRQMDYGWKMPGATAKGIVEKGRYTVEAALPMETLAKLKLLEPKPGGILRCGLFRAEFSHDRSGKAAGQGSFHTLGRRSPIAPPIEDWMSWVDPRTPEPDFHVPSSLGRLRLAR